MNLEDTIVALSSPPGRARRAIVRLSGSSALEIAGLEDAERGCRKVRFAIDGCELPTIALIARAPASYTGEDVVELLIPGGAAILERVQRTLHHRGRRHSRTVRTALPGEFTARAYLNGRIGLLEAEGIAEAIRAETDSHLRAATLMSDGRLGLVALELTAELTRLTALVEAGIDFTDEEDVVAISNVELEQALQMVIDELRAQLDGAISIERLESVPFVVLAGPANAGKSSLFNALLGTERTVVNALEGTTRDVVVEPLRLPSQNGDLEILLADLAGFDSLGDRGEHRRVEEAMQRHAHEAIKRADLIVRCTPPGATPMGLASKSAILDVATKADLAEPPGDVLATSAITGAGVDELVRALSNTLGGASNALSAGVFALTQRHEVTLRRTLVSLERAHDLVQSDCEERAPPAELLAASLRVALDALGELVGRITPDEVLEHVFARFCVGK